MAQIKETQTTTYLDYAHLLANVSNQVFKNYLTEDELKKVRVLLRQTGMALQTKQEIWDLDLSSDDPEVERDLNRLQDSFWDKIESIKTTLEPIV